MSPALQPLQFIGKGGGGIGKRLCRDGFRLPPVATVPVGRAHGLALSQTRHLVKRLTP